MVVKIDGPGQAAMLPLSCTNQWVVI